MSLVSFPLDFIKQAFPYLEKYYEFSCWSINENLERACYDNDLVVDVLPKNCWSYRINIPRFWTRTTCLSMFSCLPLT